MTVAIPPELDWRDRYPRLKTKKLMAGMVIPATLPCVVVTETADGHVSYRHYTGSAFTVFHSNPSVFTSEAWGRAIEYAKRRGLPVFRDGSHETKGERVRWTLGSNVKHPPQTT